MDALLRGIPLGQMNTSMTINATAAWLLALYVAVAERRKVPRAELQGTTQNDIVKEYLSRGTYIFPPRPSLDLTRQMIEWTVAQVPKWNPINVCSYHLQEVGATPVQEVAFALANAMAVLDSVRVPKAELGQVFGRISFFCNAGIRFIEEICKLRAFTRMWDKIGLERYGVTDKELRRFRYGVQVNSLGLTEAQPENNVPRIALEALGRDAVARRPLPRAAAPRLERGARPAAAVGPAVVAAHPADPRLRDGHARVRRHLRGLGRDRAEDRRDRGRRVGGDRSASRSRAARSRRSSRAT